MYAKKNRSKKIIVALLAVVLLVGCAVGGTIAWLMDTTGSVTNTFTVGDVTLTLKESPITVTDGSVIYGTPAENVSNQYPALPGATYKKDPVVTVDENSEKCYLFVKFEYTTDVSKYYTFTSNLTTTNGWTKLDSASSVGTATGTATEVWYRTVNKNTTSTSFDLLADLGGTYAEDITLAVKSDAVTNDTVDEASAQKLVYTAYAVQYDNVADAAAAWALLNPSTNS